MVYLFLLLVGFVRKILFLSLSVQGRSILYNAFREYLACLKIKEDYQNTLEQDQKVELTSRTLEASKKIQKEAVTAYNQIHKFTASDGLTTIELKQFSESLDRQISTNLYEKLKEEEWLLETVGHNTLKKNNLLPTDGNPIQSNQVLEAFLRYDDKPMISNKSAVQDSITKYCYNKQFAIGSKSSEDWTKMFFGETIPMFDVEDETYWLVSTDDFQIWQDVQDKSENNSTTAEPAPDSIAPGSKPKTEDVVISEGEKEISLLVISGTANAIAFNQLFSSFIMPLKENDVKIEFTITAKSKPNYPITKNSQQYKIVKESASQMGFDLEED